MAAEPAVDLSQLSIDTIRTLAMDAVQAANSGHPGMPMGCAPLAYVLYREVMKHDPADPAWPDRDRFVLSAGHASLALYVQLYLSGYGLELDDLRRTRKLGSATPGHPERGVTAGVETTTGPLGQGIANAVGMAMAARRERGLLDPDAAAEALSLEEDAYSAIEIQVDDVFASSEVATRLADEDLTVIDWQDENEELLSGLAAQSGSSLMIQAFVLVAVALGIASTLAISAVQKTRQVGILKAMGMTDSAAGRIFLLQAAILGVCGVAAGIGLGYLLIFGFSFAPVDFSVRPSLSLIAISAVIGVAVAMLSSIIPSRSTSRVDPIEVIQGG